MTDPNRTLIAVLLDRSGSMSAIQKDMQGGFDAFIAEQRVNAPENMKINVTLAQFDNAYDLVYSDLPIDEVPPLRLQPRATTALLDGIAKITNDVGEQLAALEEDERPGRVLVIVITDGQENASREWNADAVRELINRQENEWNWTYVFLGANMDAIAEGAKMGMHTNTSLTYAPTPTGTQNAYAALSRATMDWMENDPIAMAAPFSFDSDDRKKAVDE